MALSPLSLNPSTSSSSSCKYGVSHSLHFLLATSKPLRVSCCQRLVQFDTEQQPPQQQERPQRIRVDFDVTKLKKKRKPRPSFLEQVQNKWSTKLGSRRDKFPWQVEEDEEEEAESETESHTESETGIGGKASSLSDSVSFVLPSNVVSAPWAHGITEPLEPQVDSEPETKESSDSGFGRKFGVPVGSGIPKTSYRFHEEFDTESDDEEDEHEDDEEEQEEEGEEKEERVVSVDVKAFSLPKTRNVNEKDALSSVSQGISLEETRNVNKKEGISTVLKGFSLHKTRNGHEEDDNLASSGYDSSDQGNYASGDVAISNSVGFERFKWRRSNTADAEKTIPEHELKRLRNISLRMPGRIKVGARGITQELVDSIRKKWELDEVVKLKFEEPLSRNMRRTHGILENKTGGLVIWRSGSLIVLYRGMAYNLHCVQSYSKQIRADTTQMKDSEVAESNGLPGKRVKNSVKTVVSSAPISAERMKGLSKGEIKHLNDLNDLLDGLGPRFTDWLGREPLPVDADLLPALVPNYKTPFRLIPYGVKHCIGNKEMTRFRRIAREMPPHFALGRNRELQGLAKAMVKLWEKSAIAKIAIKRGVQNTCNERMAEELKTLTGGTLLSRNKDYIVFYRGNDFLPPAVTKVLKERRKLRDLQQEQEEQIRLMAPAFIESKTKASTDQLVAGTLAETKAATARWGRKPSSVEFEKMIKDSSMARQESIIRHLEKKLALAKGNLTKANKALAKVQRDLDPSDLPDDLETITDEERFLFRRMGLKMRPFLPLGKRGLYDGTVENMHLHWKYRELVKIVMKAKNFEKVKYVATSLEAESGGVLVSIDKTLKGYAIIVYRGKNYQSPDKIRPKNLLTKRQALAQSTELQRRQALRHHIWDLQERIGLLKSELEESRNSKMIDAEGTSHSTVEDSLSSDRKGTSNSTVHGSLSSDDEGTLQLTVEDSLSSDDEEFLEDNDEDTYLEIYDSRNGNSYNEHRVIE